MMKRRTFIGNASALAVGAATGMAAPEVVRRGKEPITLYSEPARDRFGIFTDLGDGLGPIRAEVWAGYVRMLLDGRLGKLNCFLSIRNENGEEKQVHRMTMAIDEDALTFFVERDDLQRVVAIPMRLDQARQIL